MAKGEKFEVSRECDFDAEVRELDRGACSPRITDPSFTGVVINVPETIELEAGSVRVPIACTYAHRPADGRTTSGPLRNAIVFVVVDLNSHQTFSGSLPPIQNLRPPPPGFGEGGSSDAAKSDFEVVDEVIEGYLNLDLAKLLGLPSKSGEYAVYATVEKHKSNVLEFRIVGVGN